jgi:3-dehydroquinate synthase
MNHWILNISKHQNTIICYEQDSSYKLSKIIKKYKNHILFVDEKVYLHHHKSLESFKTIEVIKDVEKSKSLSSIEQLTNLCIKNNINKSSLIIAIGGGALSDLIGFFSSIYMRGIDLAIVPTTILSMADASVGGKNGVNFGELKNYIGTIRQPNYIINDIKYLNSLPKEEFISGFAEIIKYACIDDNKLFETLEKHDLEYYLNEPNALLELIKKCVMIKCKFVEKDSEDKNVRKKLNFGHTYGHIYEKHQNLPHGYAVSLGINIAAKLSVKHGLLSLKECLRIQNVLQKYLLPIEPNDSIQNIEKYLFKDKKSDGHHIDFILLKKIGVATIVSLDENQVSLT